MKGGRRAWDASNFAQRLVIRLEHLSADKIGYISIISCNINILHRMLCE